MSYLSPPRIRRRDWVHGLLLVAVILLALAVVWVSIYLLVAWWWGLV